ncbi:MAG: hypothetical protein V4579_03775 [Pseudomonadota bacterium]
MNRPFHAALLRALPFMLPFAAGACQKEEPAASNASGEILPGSISDAMLPEDRVTSKPPLAPPTDVRGQRTEPAATEAPTTEPTAPEATAEPTPE